MHTLALIPHHCSKAFFRLLRREEHFEEEERRPHQALTYTTRPTAVAAFLLTFSCPYVVVSYIPTQFASVGIWRSKRKSIPRTDCMCMAKRGTKAKTLILISQDRSYGKTRRILSRITRTYNDISTTLPGATAAIDEE
ncbi:hypothetical protein BV22DRAFT_523656 [Leucogyrophana mollusca]|uniref:Uncharacterized protein n=1 Tax=Leucogyrophana mollusca TaxID=85980 RepID=A0ACB8BEU7_9AGAM|nr:hypothetical protein BV22DRAFT_523656 [Leucogyrophana mollusca]